MEEFFRLLVQYRTAFLNGLCVTLHLIVVVWMAGLTFGTLFGVLSHRYRGAIGSPLKILAFLLSGIPLLVLLFWCHYPLQSLTKTVIDPFITASVVLSVVNIFTVSGLVSAAMANFPEQYILAAKVCGLGATRTFLRIQFPIMLRQLLPSILLQQVVMLHSSLFASLIAVEELFRVAQRVNATEYRPIEIYTALALFFLAICLPLNGVAIYLRYRFTRDLSEN